MNIPFLQKIISLISSDIGIDLGTANTLVYLSGHGIVINEPSVVSINQKTGRVVAIGNDAKQMIGRTPIHITAIRPLVEGVISDFEVTEEMLTYFINKARRISKTFFPPRIVIGVPSNITNVETRAVRDAAKNAGARDVYIVEEPMAAAIGIRLPIYEPIGNMIVDIGGGTTDIAIISLGGIVASKNIRIAGDNLNENIISYIKDEFKIIIGERTAEEVKISIGGVKDEKGVEEYTVRGRDMMTGLPREVVITDTDIKEAIAPSVNGLIESVKSVLESAPPEIVADIMKRGIVLVGGGALIKGLPDLLYKEIQIPIYIADEPLTAVARGTGIILSDTNTYVDVLIRDEDEFNTTKQ